MKTTTLTNIVDKAAYDALLEFHPGLVEIIRDLLLSGQTPADIEEHLRPTYGHRETLRYVRHCAEYLARGQ